jgi:site-specific DNA recombinase
VTRQEEDCGALCERRGWVVAEVYADNDVSAYSGKPRPAWQQLISDVQAGAVGTGVCMGDPSEGPAVTPHPGPHSSR